MVTRDNYEEYFLLYVDNELSPAERKGVEAFVKENPDLEEEWAAIQGCKLNPDNEPVFKDRDSLLRIPLIAGGELNDDNCEAWFISYIDGELDGEGRLRVEQYARRHPEKAKLIDLLRQTVSIPEPAIVFPDKQMLYKKEGDRKVIPFRTRIMQMAAAAAVISAIGLLLFRYGATGTLALLKSGRKGDTGITKTVNAGRDITEKKEIPGVTPAIADPLYTGGKAGRADAKKQENDTGTEKITEETAGTTAKGNLVRTVKTMKSTDGDEAAKTKSEVQLPVTVDKGKNDPVLKDEKNRMETERPLTEELVKTGTTDQVKTGKDGKEPEQKNNNAVSLSAGNDTRKADPKDANKPNADFATQALLNPSGTQGEEGLAMEPASPKKKKMRGIFRRVSRVFENTSSLDDPDAENGKHGVLIGAFQVALK